MRGELVFPRTLEAVNIRRGVGRNFGCSLELTTAESDAGVIDAVDGDIARNRINRAEVVVERAEADGQRLTKSNRLPNYVLVRVIRVTIVSH